MTDSANLIWDNVNTRLGIGTTTPVDTLSLGIAPLASATRASLNLSNTALVGGSASGTYLGANPAAFTGNFIDLQVAGVSKFKVSSTGVITGDGSGLTGVSGAISGLNSGRVALSTGTTTVGDSANLLYNSTTGALTMGGTAPSITSSDAITIAAGGTNKNVVLTPSGTGYTLLNGKVGIGLSAPGYPLDVSGAIQAISFRFPAGETFYDGWGVTMTSPDGSHPYKIAGTSLMVGYSTGGADVGVGNFMASGMVGIGTMTPVSKLHVATAPTAATSYGLLSLGSAPFDGATAGFFTGHASGTVIAVNPAAGYAGDLVNLQIAGVQKFKVDKDGKIYGDGSQLTSLPGAISSLTAGRVPYASNATTIIDSANLTWDNTNAALTIGTLKIHQQGATSSTFVGEGSGAVNAGASQVGIGKNALSSNISGSNSTGVGAGALQYQTTGGNNTALGMSAAWGLKTGAENVAVGNSALYMNNVSGAGNQNTAIGYESLKDITTGNGNTGVGHGAGVTATPANAVTTGSNNTYIGFQSGPGTAAQLTNATAIGYRALATVSNSLILGGTGAQAVRVGIGTTVPHAEFEVAGQIWANNADGYVSLIPNAGSNYIQTGTQNGAAAKALTISGPSGTAFPVFDVHAAITEFKDTTAATGATQFYVTEGAGQSTTQVFGVFANDGTTSRLAVTDGKVGIGTVSPTVKLDISVGAIAANGYGGMRLADGTTDFWQLIKKDVGGVARMSIYDGNATAPLVFQENGGNVGVGTTSPKTTLDVNGVARLARYGSAPFACDAARAGSLAMTSGYKLCSCNSASWVKTEDGSTGCSW